MSTAKEFLLYTKLSGYLSKYFALNRGLGNQSTGDLLL